MRGSRGPLSARRRAPWAGLLLAAAVLSGCTGGGPAAVVDEPTPLPTVSEPATTIDPPQKQPNIVLVLMDDFSMDLLPTMRSADRMREQGASYPHSFVVDSLCCVSRTSLFTGQYPHQTGVRLNSPSSADPSLPLGGYEAFEEYGNGPRTFAVRLQRAGYTTGFVGKLLNRYEYREGEDVPPPPPGWSDFNVLFGAAYDGWGFYRSYVEAGALNVKLVPTPPADASPERKDRRYAGTVTQRIALDFIDRHRDDEQPWFLEVAPYAPHSRVAPQGAYAGDPPFPPAFRDRPSLEQPDGNCGRVECRHLGIDDLPGFGDDLSDNVPSYEDGRPAPAAWEPEEVTAHQAETNLRDRARMVQSIDRMVTKILAQVPDNTYVVLTSDNGFHLGQHGLGMGKGSAYDSDIRVPLLVVGPGVRPGERADVVSTIDLASTFEDLAGIRSPHYRSGTSLVPTFDQPDLRQNKYVFVEHTWSGSGDDPDASDGALRLVPSYVAVRSRDAVLIRSDLDPDPDGVLHGYEYYEYGNVGYERTNTYAAPHDRAELKVLKRKLRQFDACSVAVRDAPVPQECRDLRQ